MKNWHKALILTALLLTSCLTKSPEKVDLAGAVAVDTATGRVLAHVAAVSNRGIIFDQIPIATKGKVFLVAAKDWPRYQCARCHART